jgi:hypothetical protein
MLQRTTRTSIGDYRTARTEAHDICRRKGKEYEEETIQTYSVRSESRKFYQGVRRFKGGDQPRATVCTDKGGNVVGGEREVMNRRAECFGEMLNKCNPEITGNGNSECYGPQNQVQKPTPSMTYDIMKKLKKNRAQGEDGISAELLKQGGTVLWRRIYQIIVSVWEKEEMPADWQMAIICPVY